MPKENPDMTTVSSRLIYRFFALILPLTVLVSGCATVRSSKESVIWTSRGQFVTVVEREGVQATPNQQPVTISGSRLRAELAMLQIKLPDNPKAVPLFGAGELENLSEQIPAGLQKAGPDQDLVFAVLGEKEYLKGMFHKDVVTTGRVFYQNNRLNLILGLARELIVEKDRRMQPFTPGSRLQAAALPGPVATSSAAVAFQASRPDWITMALPEGEAEPAVPQAVPQAVPPAVIRSEKEVAPAAAPPATAQPARSIEERLRILGDLKAKGLITEEEFRAKRESILREL
jgi:hypothetical protein